MQNPSFENLAEQAASGLKGDRELYLDVKQELHTHLEDKAEQLYQEGHNKKESIELSCKSLGSPMDMAAELLEANEQRMKLRSLIRLFLGSLIIPVAIVCALYLGCKRAVDIKDFGYYDSMFYRNGDFDHLGRNKGFPKKTIAFQLSSSSKNVPFIKRYWETHRKDPDSRMYYAYYTIFLRPEIDKSYVKTMQLGESIEPNNAYYNIMLANYYLKRGLVSEYRSSEQPIGITDRHAFEAGLSELIKAGKKPYFQDYHSNIIRKKIASLPRPILTEDYSSFLNLSSDDFPELPIYRSIARRIPKVASILVGEKRFKDAVAVLNTGKRYPGMVLNNSDPWFLHLMVVMGLGSTINKGSIPVYQKLGMIKEAQKASRVLNQLNSIGKKWIPKGPISIDGPEQREHDSVVVKHGAMVVSTIREQGGFLPTMQELTPCRMHEHTIMEELFLYGLLLLLTIALISNVIQAGIWTIKLKRAASAPILLIPSTIHIIKALLYGIVAPCLIYWIYTRVLSIGGREYSWVSDMWPRFFIELCIMTIILFNIPVVIIKNKVKQRCKDLAIPVPDKISEMKSTWLIRAMAIVILLLITSSSNILVDYFPGFKIPYAITLPLIGAGVFVILLVSKKRLKQALYYGTIARSMIPVYAFSIILISLTIQPILLKSEIYWLKQDKIFFGFISDPNPIFTNSSSYNYKVRHEYMADIKKALECKD